MAGYPPPPFPPPIGGPYGFDPRQQQRFQRDQIKAQIRAQKAAFRAQRDLYRFQTRTLLVGNRRSSILGPLIIVAIGVVILLIRMGRVPFTRFATWYGHFWPLVLVAAGAILVAEWAFDQLPREEGAPYVRRGVGGGAIFLLILLGITGAVFSSTWAGQDFLVHGLNFDSSNLAEVFGEKHESSQPVDADFPPGTSLSVDDPHGDVTILGKSDDGKIHIIVNKQVWSHSDSDAESLAQQLSPRLSVAGGMMTVTLPSVNSSSSDVTITMPDYGETTVNANHGDVSVSSLKAGVTVNANHGDVAVDQITGSVSARLNHSSSSVSAHNVSGDVAIHGHADDVSVTDIAGQVLMEGEFYGDTHLEHLHGPVTFRTSRTQFSLARLDGDVDMSPKSELTASQIVGPIDLRTRSRNISFDRVSGDLNVVNSKGSVEVSSAAPLGNVTIDNKDGEVNVTIPDQAGVNVLAQTQGAEISSDLSLKSSDSNNVSVLSGVVGDGAAHLNIHTTHFKIQIHKGFIEPPAPLPPAPPSPPAPPPGIKPGGTLPTTPLTPTHKTRTPLPKPLA